MLKKSRRTRIYSTRSCSVSILGCATLMAGLAGCSSSLLESPKIDYKSASKREQNALEIPPDLTAPTRDERFTVPDVAPKGSATYSAYTSDRAQPQVSATEVLPAADKMRIERSGTQRWLVVQGTTPDKVWPVVKEFWLETGFILILDRPELGVMETDWAEDRAKIPQDIVRSTIGKVLDGLYSTPERDKFRTRLEAGKDSGTVEIYVSHRGMMEIYPNEAKDRTIWQPRPADPELEAEMLRRLMVRLGAQEERAKQALVAQPAEARASLRQAGDGRVALMVAESFDRSWRRVGLALDRIGFAVEDRDRAKGLYYVRYIDPDKDNQSKKDDGILSKLAFWRDDKPAQSSDIYRIYVRAEGEGSTVTVLSQEGGEDRSVTARRILQLLQEQLK
jgi:outer membrane protein assembly factor BamC